GWRVLAREEEEPGEMRRLGMLETISAPLNAANYNAFREGMRALGYIEGRNFVIEYRSAEGRGELFPELVAELLRLKVDVIVTRGTPAVLAAALSSQAIVL